MITGDKNLAYQQNLKNRKIALIVLGTTHRYTLEANMATVLAAVSRAKPGSFEQLPTPPYVPRPKSLALTLAMSNGTARRTAGRR